MWTAIGTSLSLLIGAAGLFLAWRAFRTKVLRTDDVLNWSYEVIEVLQTLCVVCTIPERLLTSEEEIQRLTNIVFRSSILVEKGRLFFRNEIVDDYGQEKPPAYRGYRPIILDYIVRAYEIAKAWPDATGEERLRLCAVAEDCEREFVSLAQKEVGRDLTASADTKAGGSGSRLYHLMDEVAADRIARLRSLVRVKSA